MKEMTLSEVQQCGLDILKDIHLFCTHHNISYSLSGGSLIGAIRHKGFIPWDDDIDIMMPRPSYDLFCHEYVSEKYKLIEMHHDKSCMIGFAKVCDVYNTYTEGVAWTEQRVGISVDIFPFDGVQPEFEEFAKDCQRYSKLWKSLIINRAIQLGPTSESGFKINFLSKLVNTLHLKRLNLAFAHNKLRKLDKHARSIPFESSKYCSQIVMLQYGIKEYYPSSIFDSVHLVQFEDEYFFSIDEYDVYLSRLYGNYMELPPQEERVPKHVNFKYYWI